MKLNSLITNDYIFFLGRMYFTSNGGITKHPCSSTNPWYVRIKKYKDADYVLSWKSKGVYNSKLKAII